MSDDAGQPELLPGLRETVRAAQASGPARTAVKKAVEIAEVDPVARVLVDVPLAHLDRPFDYAVPATMAQAAVPGARVKVRFAGQDLDAVARARSYFGEYQPSSPSIALLRDGEVLVDYSGGTGILLDRLRLRIFDRRVGMLIADSSPISALIAASARRSGPSASLA